MTADCIGAPLLPSCRDARGAGSARHPAAPRTQPGLGALHRPGGGGVVPVFGRVPACPAACPGGPEGVHAYPGGCPGLSAKGAGAPRRPSRAPRKPSRGLVAATPACRGEWAGLSASCSRGCRRQGPGMPRIGGVYGWGWRGAKFSGSRVPQSCSRAPRGMGGRAGGPVGWASAQGGRACGEVGRVAGAVASTSGRVARIALAVGAGGSGGSGGPAGGGPRSSPRATHPRGPCDNCARTPPPGGLSVQSQNSAGPAT